ncbi:hypothetical protein [Aquibacillus saliphilus]|uniref:hypothetical protein n=1 Tax=Aquibacillus saliphilus TaxID=1909422 RepID=UPI001CF03B2E|nr:hypothetical protein [Aquibacillus saliphilus]
MEEQLRTKRIKEIQQGEPVMTGIKINYDGENKTLNAYKIPLDYLIYNKYNGRIGSVVKSFEKQYRELNPVVTEDKEIIEEFLWESQEKRNEKTQTNLVELGQQQYGIVTSDGIIVDGNRRGSLLNRIYKNREKWEKQNHNVDHCRYFTAVILPENADKKAIMKLETTYQLGSDEKLDYNPIEKYLKCKDLKDEGFTEPDISKMMSENLRDVKKMLEIMELMDDYLDYLDYSGVYTRLEKREGPMVDLQSYLKQYNSPNGCPKVNWDYDDSDITDLKAVCFDYIRAQYEGKEFRTIAKPSKKDGIFCNEKVWDSFLNKHFNNAQEIKEPSPSYIFNENPDASRSKLLATRDVDWSKKIKLKFQDNLKKSEGKLEDVKQANEPLELLRKALDTLESINIESLKKVEEEKTIKDLEKLIGNFSLKFTD